MVQSNNYCPLPTPRKVQMLPSVRGLDEQGCSEMLSRLRVEHVDRKEGGEPSALGLHDLVAVRIKKRVLIMTEISNIFRTA